MLGWAVIGEHNPYEVTDILVFSVFSLQKNTMFCIFFQSLNFSVLLQA